MITREHQKFLENWMAKHEKKHQVYGGKETKVDTTAHFRNNQVQIQIFKIPPNLHLLF